LLLNGELLRLAIMPGFFKEEISALGRFFHDFRSEITVVAFGMLFMVLHEYHPIGKEWLSAFFYYGIFPILVLIIVLRKNPLHFGLGWGSPRIWWPYVAVFWAVGAAILFAASFNPSLKEYYIDADFNIVYYVFTSCLSLFAQEFMFRGFLLFGLKDRLKEGAILVQMVPFVLVHLGKPELETISTIVTGILFGFVAYRGRSFWPAFLIHIFINVFFVGIINWRYG
jgi:membrane protease YdiL (CAAX protease family)